MGGCRDPVINVRIGIRGGLRSIYQRWRKNQSRYERKNVQNRVFFEEAVGFPALRLLASHISAVWPQAWQVNFGSRSDSRTTSGCHWCEQ